MFRSRDCRASLKVGGLTLSDSKRGGGGGKNTFSVALYNFQESETTSPSLSVVLKSVQKSSKYGFKRVISEALRNFWILMLAMTTASDGTSGSNFV